MVAAPDSDVGAGFSRPGLRVVFFGTPEFAVPTLRHLLESGHPVVGVVTQPDRPRGRGQQVSVSPVKALALDAQLPILQPERMRDAAFFDTLRSWQPDLGVVAAYGKLLPDDLLALPRLGMINVHASLLPKYRGAGPIHRAVINGDPETGVTIMRVERRLDAGPMLARSARPIGPDETTDVVERALADLGAPLLVSVVDQIAAGTAREEPQDEALATHAPRITREEGLIDWTRPTASVHNLVRGLYPWPHAFTYLGGTRLIVRRTSLDADSTDAAPGTIVDASRGRLLVATGTSGRIALEEIQLEGRRPMAARDFLAGHPLTPGTRFTGPGR